MWLGIDNSPQFCLIIGVSVSSWGSCIDAWAIKENPLAGKAEILSMFFHMLLCCTLCFILQPVILLLKGIRV